MFQLHLPTPNLLIFWWTYKEHLPSLCRKPPLKLHLGSVSWSTSTLLLWYIWYIDTLTLNQNYLEILLDASTRFGSLPVPVCSHNRERMDGSRTFWLTCFLACLSTFYEGKNSQEQSAISNIFTVHYKYSASDKISESWKIFKNNFGLLWQLRLPTFHIEAFATAWPAEIKDVQWKKLWKSLLVCPRLGLCIVQVMDLTNGSAISFDHLWANIIHLTYTLVSPDPTLK